MKNIIFKVKENKLNIFVSPTISNKEFLSLLKERLQRLIVVKESIARDVILNIDDRMLDNREILELFDILNDTNIFYISKIVCKNVSKDSLTIYKGSFRGGQVRFFNKSCLIIGTINKSSKVVVNGDLYVLGKIIGEVELKDKSSSIYCEYIEDSLVKIGDIYKYYGGVTKGIEIYLDNNVIKEREYKKGEMNSGKSNSCYIG